MLFRYLTAGAFPVNPSPSPHASAGHNESYNNYMPATKNIRINMHTTRAELVRNLDLGGGGGVQTVENCSSDPTNCYAAAITKTTDCGRTWATPVETLPLATDNLLENTDGGTPTPSLFSRGGSLLPFIYADARPLYRCRPCCKGCTKTSTAAMHFTPMASIAQRRSTAWQSLKATHAVCS